MDIEKQIVILEPHGLCAGVNAAVAKALQLRQVFCLHALVHNDIIIQELTELGFKFVDDIDQVPDGETVVFSAHGVSPLIRLKANQKHLKVVDTTCPFVTKVHQAVKEFATNNIPVVVLGDKNHIEVQGIVGEVELLGGKVAVIGMGDVCPFQHNTTIGIVAQTTANKIWVNEQVKKLQQQYNTIVKTNVCNATEKRQAAVRDFTGDALLVLGSKHSANTRRLTEIAKCPTFLAESLDDVRKLKEELDQYRVLGVTAGASTPERLVNEVVKMLRNIPEHIAIIMDGNGRWAEKQGMARTEGHKIGAKRVSEVVKWCTELGIRYLTLYAFSTENWKRPKTEVALLMRLFKYMLQSQKDELIKNQVRLRVIGRRGDLPNDLVNLINELEAATAQFNQQLILCMSYGGRAEIVDAVNEAILKQQKVTEETFRQFLYAPDVPDPDLIIRTSGELRTSNFLLWESAYAEYYFTSTCWPDFSKTEFDNAIDSFSNRQRRNGKISELKNNK